MEAKLSTNHDACKILADVLHQQGVRRVVISPGSRNAPLIVAFSRISQMAKTVIVDERSAAFVAVGMCQQLSEPVALVCTSGSAVLNYAPAVAEAYYQHLPLIVISADRQIEWIDQNDSQTIRQNGILKHIVKKSFNIPYQCDSALSQWYVNRCANDAVITALSATKAPVHINVQLNGNLYELKEYFNKERVITKLPTSKMLTDDAAKMAVDKIRSTSKVMFVVSMLTEPNAPFERHLNELSKLPNVVVLTETISNMRGQRFVSSIDKTLAVIPQDKRADYAPDLIVYIGGSLVSRKLKDYLRAFSSAEQWRVESGDETIDTFQHLTTLIPLTPTDFLSQICQLLLQQKIIDSDYFKHWNELKERSMSLHEEYLAYSGWSDLKAFSIILPSIPEHTHLQLSNGTAIRYAQLFDLPNCVKSNCNRGVAGIDGSTSTALGASLVYDGNTVLITGDMSLTYDLNGLNTRYNSSKFKIIVMCNGGGNIFRIINGPSSLDELEDCFEVRRDLDVKKYAAAFGFNYFEAADETSLKKQLKLFYECEAASILAVKTVNKTSSEALKNYFKKLQNI